MSNTLRLKLKRIDPVKYATIAALLTGLLMLIIFVPMFLLFTAIGAGAATESMGLGAAVFGGSVFVMLLVPIFYAVVVFIVTLISTSLLNFMLKKTGGLDIDFEKAGLDINRIGE